ASVTLANAADSAPRGRLQAVAVMVDVGHVLVRPIALQDGHDVGRLDAITQSDVVCRGPSLVLLNGKAGDVEDERLAHPILAHGGAEKSAAPPAFDKIGVLIDRGAMLAVLRNLRERCRIEYPLTRVEVAFPPSQGIERNHAPLETVSIERMMQPYEELKGRRPVRPIHAQEPS